MIAMAKHTYSLLSGETIEYAPTNDAVAAFMDRVRKATDDPHVSVVELEVLVYGLENPLLSINRETGRAVVTRATYEDPCFHVMLDLIGRKRVTVGHLDLEAARVRHTMTVREAAKLLGITEGAVRQAIYAGRLSYWRDAGVYYLDPSVVKAYRVVRRQHAPKRTALEVRCGSADDTTFKVKTLNGLTGRSKVGNVVTGMAEDWKRIVVLASKNERARCFVIVPGPDDDVIEFNGFFVRGRFSIDRTENNARRARELYSATTPE